VAAPVERGTIERVRAGHLPQRDLMEQCGTAGVARAAASCSAQWRMGTRAVSEKSALDAVRDGWTVRAVPTHPCHCDTGRADVA
jgi:hypothetical protein